MLAAAIATQLVLMIGIPAWLAWRVPRVLDTPRSLIWMGALVFVASQGLRLLLLSGPGRFTIADGIAALPVGWRWPAQIALLCVTAGLFEEVGRWLGFRYLVRGMPDWPKAVTFGVGHGAVEAMVFGAMSAVTALMMYLIVKTPAGVQSSPALSAVTPAQLQAYLATPWYEFVLGGLERLFAMSFHVAMSLMVARAIVGRAVGWLLVAITLHALVDAVALVSIARYGIFVAEAALAAVAAVSLWFVAREHVTSSKE